MTKEMRPSHREDVLTHALVYYGIRTKKRLGICTQHSFLYDSVFSILFVHLAKLMLKRPHYQRDWINFPLVEKEPH